MQALQTRRATVAGGPVAGAPARTRPAAPTTAARVLALQRQAGNAAVAGLFVQRKEGCDCGGSCCTSDEKEQPAPVAVQRDADDIRIKGLFPGRAGIHDEIFFDHGKHDLDKVEQDKLRVIAEADKKAKLVLKGFASEEGTKGGNTAIVNNRMVMVSYFLGKFGNKQPRKFENKVAEGGPGIDYRRQRRVEVVRPGVKKDECKEGPIVTCGSDLTKAYERAKFLLAEARSKMAGPTAGFLPALDTFYKTKDLAVAGLVLGQLDQLIRFVDESSTREAPPGHEPPKDAHHRCENLCGKCRSGFAAQAGPSPPSVLFCPPYFAGSVTSGVANDPAEERAHILIHECGHAIGLRELARVFERAFPFLGTADALRNTDSLTAFVRQLVTPGQTSNGPVKADTGPGMSPETTKALAFTERWALLAHFQVNNVYNAAATLEKRKQNWIDALDLTDPDDVLFLESYEAVAAEFPPMSPRSKVPKVDDRQRLAAVNDRFKRMADDLGEPVEVVAGPTVTWTKPQAGPHIVAVPATFASLSLGDQCRALLRALARTTQGISPEAVEKYARLAPKLSNAKAPGFVPQ